MIALTNQQLAETLEASGWLRPGGRKEKAGAGYTEPEIKHALEEYQDWWGLEHTGEADEQTTKQLLLPRICSLPDRMELFRGRGRQQVCRWEKTRLRWTLLSTAPGIPLEDFRRGIEIAWRMWEEVCGIRAEYTEDRRAADVVTEVGRIDGPGGTLAWAELPCGPDRQRQKKYGAQEPWAVSVNPPARYVSLPIVAAHEIGHILGLDHTNTRNQLLNSTYNSAVPRPQAGWDIPQAVSRYGRPVPRPPVRPDPPVIPPEPPVAELLPISIDLASSVITWGSRTGDILWRN